MNPPDWFDLSRRLRRILFKMEMKGTLFGFKWSQQCSHWVMLIIKKKDIYIDD